MIRQSVYPELPHQEVHIWLASLNQSDFELTSLWKVLAADERGRAGQFHFERDRKYFVAARGILRCLLGRYLGVAPHEIIFGYGPAGKPTIEDPRVGLEFNLSHAGDLALYAFSSCGAVGIDHEPLGKTVTWHELAPMVFSTREQEELKRYPDEEKPHAFLRGWTRKEAYVKARSGGLSMPLDQFSVPLAHRQKPLLVCIAGSEGTSHNWWLHVLDTIQGYAAALVVEGGPAILRYQTWTG